MSYGDAQEQQGSGVLRMLADRWQDAADEAACPTLRDCYARRAARYRELAAARLSAESVQPLH
jgi:hypothetical protein